MDKSAEVILPGVPYFQVVFTLPDKLSALILGNRQRTLQPAVSKCLESTRRRTSPHRQVPTAPP